MKTVKNLIICLVLLAIMGVVIAISLFIDNGQSNYYISYGDRQLSIATKDLELQKNSLSVFYVDSIMSANKKVQADDYNVQIKFNKAMFPNINCYINDRAYDLNKIDLSSAFNLCKKDGYFTINIDEELTLSKAIAQQFPEKVVRIENDIVNLWEKDTFLITVEFIKEKKHMTISFH